MYSKKRIQKRLLDVKPEMGLTPLSKNELKTIEGGGWLIDMARAAGCYVGKMLSSAEMDFVNSPIHGPDGYKYM